MEEIDTTQPQPSTPDPPRGSAADNGVSPPHTLRRVRTMATRRSTIAGVATGRPSPYKPRVMARSEDDTDTVRAGIGGPPKRRESLSGIGNNLRSYGHAGLGRAVGRSVPKDQTPSGLTNLLRRASACDAPPQASPGSPPVHTAGMPQRQRRGSSSTASTATADASSPTAGQTVFPMNPAFTFNRQRPQRRQTVGPTRYLRPSDAPGLSPRHSTQQAAPSSIPLARLEQIRTMPPDAAFSLARQRNAASASLDGPPMASPIHRTATGATQKSSPDSPVGINMIIGSPSAGEIVDVVGSYSRPSVVYAAARRPSRIGGTDEGKSTMQDRVGLGGKRGKKWMADRPSNLGAPAPRGEHPESGLHKLFKSLNFGARSKDRSSEPSSPRLS
ncbi:hypothetical protein H4S01_003518 [Coemansia sp. RSA 2610]|nr:hypothetical protein H4S01_003518 [Coemansia sp. RSA 2610]